MQIHGIAACQIRSFTWPTLILHSAFNLGIYVFRARNLFRYAVNRKKASRTSLIFVVFVLLISELSISLLLFDNDGKPKLLRKILRRPANAFKYKANADTFGLEHVMKQRWHGARTWLIRSFYAPSFESHDWISCASTPKVRRIKIRMFFFLTHCSLFSWITSIRALADFLYIDSSSSTSNYIWPHNNCRWLMRPFSSSFFFLRSIFGTRHRHLLCKSDSNSILAYFFFLLLIRKQIINLSAIRNYYRGRVWNPFFDNAIN